MAYAGFGTEPTGARNAHQGGYDAALVFHVIIGVPVYFAFRGFAYVLGEEESRRTNCPAVVLTGDEAMPAVIRLRASWALRAMAIFYWLLWAVGLVGLVGVLAYLLGPEHKPPPVELVAAGFVGASLFLPLLVLYKWLQRPSSRQLGIRRIAQRRYGVHSDPATWAADSVAAMGPALAFNLADPNSLLEAAVTGEDDETGMLMARVALAMAPNDEWLVRRAEEVTDELLLRLG